ncbi:MAG: pitrilysin family protein [Hyphomicrobiales bacterium]|nr:pitrilysin family protein [Hyphomicrobiales bacterium]
MLNFDALISRKPHLISIWAAAIMMLISSPYTSSNAQGRAFHTKLANGMEVVVLPDRRAPVVTHMVWYRVGGADEPIGKSGIAHFLEHLMFKGTQKIAPGEFSKIIARNGGQDNAFTSNDVTAYFQRVSKDRLPLIMEMEADRMVNLRLDENDVTTERKVILEERRSRVDNEPLSILQEQMQAAFYLAHPYGIPVIGWEHEIEKLNRQDALGFYKKFYAPNNAILVIAGDVSPEDVMLLAEKFYGVIPANPDAAVRSRVQEPDHAAERRVVLKDSRAGKATLQRIYMAPAYPNAAPSEAEALEMLARIAGSSKTSRMYMKLVVEEKKASSASGWFSGAALDSGSIAFYAVAAGDAKLEDIEALMDGVLADVRENGVTQEELDRARNAAVADIVYMSDNQASMARTYGWALATGRTVQDVETRAERLAKVTVEDVKKAANKYLDIKRSVTGLLFPAPSQTANVARPSTPKQPGAGVH